ncbi:TolC family protein [Paraflavisolibacter sp. H34]|uniref:TolC family protein n=1 Tax=Huijunlia imazamoxiresistens TaxID=3127457 RepID=UPI00301B0BCF
MKKVIPKVVLAAVTLLFAGARQAQAQQRYELTVKEAVELAFKNVAELKNAKIDYKLQEAKNREIEGSALPQVSGTAGAQYYMKLPVFLFPDATSTAVYSILKDEGVSGAAGPITKIPEPKMQQVSFQQPWNLGVGAGLTQLLFQPDVFVGLKARQTALDYSSSMIDQTREKIKDDAYKKYYAILIGEKQLHFLNEGVKRLEKLYHDDSVMYKNGFAEKLDLDKVQVQLTNLKTTQNTVRSGIELSYAALKFALGLSQADTVKLKEELTVAQVKKDILQNDFKYEDRPEIRTLNHVKRLQELDKKRYQMGNLPTVALAGNYSINAMGQKFFTNDNTLWFKSSYVGLNVNVPIFDGFQRRQKVNQAQLNVEKVDNTLANAKQGIDLEQVMTRESLKNALLNLDIQERNVGLAERVYQTTKIKFEQGLGSSFEVLQADNDFQTAQSNFFTALYNAVVAKVSYLKSLGKLDEKE